MRLIDADELKTILSEEITRRFVRWDKTITVAEWETFTRDVIDNAPTVESNIIELFNKYDVLLVHEGGQIVPVKNTTKQDCYDLLYEIQELIEWRKILFNKNLNDVYKEGEQNA